MKLVKLAVVMLVLFLAGNARADVIQDFSNGSFGDWDIISGYWQIVPDVQPDGTIGNIAKITGTESKFGGNAMIKYKCGQGWRDYTLEADVRMDSGGDFWMAWRNDVGQNYAQWFRNTLRATYCCGPRGWGVWGYYSWPWQYGKWYHLKAVLNGPSQKFYVDDQLMFEYTSDLYAPTGGVNFRTLWSKMSLDNIVIRGVDGCTIPATVNVDPDTLNMNSKGGSNSITAYIELPEGHDVSEISVDTVRISTSVGTVAAQIDPTAIGDHDEDGIADLMVKFDRSAVIWLVQPGDEVSLEVSGEAGGKHFAGSDTIRVIE